MQKILTSLRVKILLKLNLPISKWFEKFASERGKYCISKNSLLSFVFPSSSNPFTFNTPLLQTISVDPMNLYISMLSYYQLVAPTNEYVSHCQIPLVLITFLALFPHPPGFEINLAFMQIFENIWPSRLYIGYYQILTVNGGI